MQKITLKTGRESYLNNEEVVSDMEVECLSNESNMLEERCSSLLCGYYY